MNFIFEIIDKTGRKIHLSKKQWTHITKRHPYIANCFEEIKETVKNPDKITDYSIDINVRYYYKYFKHKKTPNKHLSVVVKYLNGEGFIISAFFTTKIK